MMFKDPRNGKYRSVQNNYDNKEIIVSDSTEVFQDMENPNKLVTSGTMSMNNRHNLRVDEVRAYTVIDPQPGTRTFGEPMGRLTKKDW